MRSAHEIICAKRRISKTAPIVIPQEEELVVIWPGPGFGIYGQERDGRITAFLYYENLSVYDIVLDDDDSRRIYDLLYDKVDAELVRHESKLLMARAIHAAVKWNDHVDHALDTAAIILAGYNVRWLQRSR